jgi:hypothetical protein
MHLLKFVANAGPVVAALLLTKSAVSCKGGAPSGPGIDLTVEPTYVCPGAQVKVTWNATNGGDSVDIGQVGSGLPATGTRTFSAPSSDFTIEAKVARSSDNCTATVTRSVEVITGTEEVGPITWTADRDNPPYWTYVGTDVFMSPNALLVSVFVLRNIPKDGGPLVDAPSWQVLYQPLNQLIDESTTDFGNYLRGTANPPLRSAAGNWRMTFVGSPLTDANVIQGRDFKHFTDMIGGKFALRCD